MELESATGNQALAIATANIKHRRRLAPLTVVICRDHQCSLIPVEASALSVTGRHIRPHTAVRDGAYLREAPRGFIRELLRLPFLIIAHLTQPALAFCSRLGKHFMRDALGL